MKRSAPRFTPLLLIFAASAAAAEPRYPIRIDSGFLRMRDGVELSVTTFAPVPAQPGERFPALLEMLPYRKDDSFYLRDYPLYTYFARRGFLMAKVDVRGTGSSRGLLPGREYSETEIDDAVDCIDRLSRLPECNGNVGMWGISWGGFNAIQTAMRQPPALKAILAVDASDDLYHDDIHYLDGCFHMDRYALSVAQDVSMPRGPQYALDADYFRERFDRPPWLLTVLKQWRDGPYWQRGSLRRDYGLLRVPAYLIGGLLDFYRDSVPRMLEHVRAPVTAVLGPWNHSWPDNGTPGPNFEWRRELTAWWNRWLRGEPASGPQSPNLTLFVRDYHRPDAKLATTPGHWRMEQWPLARARRVTLIPTAAHRLGHSPGPAGTHSLTYVPGCGTAADQWWGDPTPDMAADDACSLVYDSEPLTQTEETVGFPRVWLAASLDASHAHWIARLEDVAPDGTVTLVTGGALNGSQRVRRSAPEPWQPGRFQELLLELHFTTWTFRPGHRVRLAIANAQFPMIWPVEGPLTSTLRLGTTATRLELPVIPYEPRPAPAFLPPEPRERRPDARELPSAGWPALHRTVRDDRAGTVSVEWYGSDRYEIRGRRHRQEELSVYSTRMTAPAAASFHGDASHWVEWPGRSIRLRTRMEVVTDAASVHATVRRQILENGRLVRDREWRERIPRGLR